MYVCDQQPTLRDHGRGKSWVVSMDLYEFWWHLRLVRRESKFSRQSAFACAIANRVSEAEAAEHFDFLVDSGLILDADSASRVITLCPEASRWIRLVRGELLHEYLVTNALWRRYGNRLFARIVVNRPLLSAIAAREIDVTSCYQAVAYHVFLPGLVPCLHAFRDSENDLGSFFIQECEITTAWNAAHHMDISGLVERSQNLFIAIQNDHELSQFLKIVAAKQPRLVVEIGTARGGVLFCLCQVAHPNAFLISIDLPGGANCGGQSSKERELFATFAGPSQRMEFIPRDSHDALTKEHLRQALSGRKIDLLFVDGDHAYDGVKQDFDMYKDLMAGDGMIAFHDIELFPDEWGPDTGVGTFWKELSARYPVTEIVDTNGTARREKLPNELSRWGIGLVGCSCLSV
jgi:predicted O-methyltransferase YrrM